MTETTDIRPTDDAAREYDAARKRLERRRKFRGDLVAYVVINAGLVITWAITGAGYFWPGWVLGAWGVALALDAWTVYFQRPVTAADIEHEMNRSR